MLVKNKNKNPACRQAGFTLIEAIIALFILSVGILACLQVFALGLKLAKNAKTKTAETLQAQACIEQELNKPDSCEKAQIQEIEPGLKLLEINNLKTYVSD